MQPVTVATLVYKSPVWLSFCLEGLVYAKNRVPSRVLVVGNDATEEVKATGRLDLDFRNEDPSEYYINRVYRAWCAAVEAAETDLVVLVNSDHYPTDGWLDALVEAKEAEPMSVPTSLQVESGRIPSAMPEYARNFGTSPETFDVEGFKRYADTIRKPGVTEPGRLFMPCLFERDTFLRLGGYPHGNPTGTTGDKAFFARLAESGYRHVTAMGSVVAHIQEGEMRG